jgi:carbamoyltransferase
MTTYWGLSYGHHDAAAVVVKDDELVFSQRAMLKDIPDSIISEMIHRHGMPDHIYTHENKKRDLIRKLKTGDWARLFTKAPPLPSKIPITQGNHHLSHAAYGFYSSPYTDAVVIVADAIGEQESLGIFGAENGLLNPIPLFTLKFPHSLGLFYSYHVALVGMEPNKDEGRFMEMVFRHETQSSGLVNGYEMKGFDFICNKKYYLRPEPLCLDYGTKSRIATDTQKVLETYLSRLGSAYKHVSKNVVFTGGVAYNWLAHGALSNYFDGFYVPRFPGDAGSALGAVLQHTNKRINAENMFNG